MWELLCQHCGGNPAAPDHDSRCDGKQGGRPEPFDPLLVAGIDPATWDTSEAAAIANDAHERETQRAAVYDAIRAAGLVGRTDDELQIELRLDGSSERPRRWELWKQNAIRILHDANGAAVRRLTRTRRRAVVWIAT